MYMRASLENIRISKTAISFNIMLVLQILCRYKWHACRSAYTCTDKFPNVPTKLWKSTPPPSPLATLMAGNAKEADIWFGESAREARGKFKDLVCLVVLLCWIKRFVLLSLCLNANIWIDIFHAFKNRGGDDPPQKNSRGGGGGDTSPPSPPGSPPMSADHCFI